MTKKITKRIIGWALLFFIVGGYFVYLGKEVAELYGTSWFLGVLISVGVLFGFTISSISIGIFIAWLLISD